LKSEGFFVRVARDGKSALRAFGDTTPDVVLLDMRLPDMSGTDVCRELRRLSDIPIVMLSAVAEEIDIVLSFELGADDYVPKPFRLRELVARMEAAMRHRERARRPEGQPVQVQDPIEIGVLRIDFDARIVEVAGKRVDLSRKEFDLLAHLATVPGRVCSREWLMEEVWGVTTPDEMTDDRTLDTHMYRLRSKLEKDPAHPCWIVTVRGVGFLMNDGRRGPHRAEHAD
jgi:two-component system response regulator RegX3